MVGERKSSSFFVCVSLDLPLNAIFSFFFPFFFNPLLGKIVEFWGYKLVEEKGAL